MSWLHEIMVAQRGELPRRHRSILYPRILSRLFPLLVAGLVVGVAEFACWRLDLSVMRVVTGFGQLGKFAWLMFPPSADGQLPMFLSAMAETLAIALLGTLTAVILALPLGFLAARNVVANPVIHFAVRRVLDVIRGIDVLIWALVFINVVGLGPFAGILAIALSDTGVFGKLFSEALENADPKPIDGVVSCGGSRLEVLTFGLVPQVLPIMTSQAIYYFESNTRSATIIGIVGAGGIGLQLAEQIRLYEWSKVSVLLAMILVTVAVIDFVSSRLRHRIIGRTILPA